MCVCIVALICPGSVFSFPLRVKPRCHCQYCNTCLIGSSGWQASFFIFFKLLNFSHSLPGTAFTSYILWTWWNNCKMILHASYFSAPSNLLNKYQKAGLFAASTKAASPTRKYWMYPFDLQSGAWGNFCNILIFFFANYSYHVLSYFTLSFSLPFLHCQCILYLFLHSKSVDKFISVSYNWDCSRKKMYKCMCLHKFYHVIAMTGNILITWRNPIDGWVVPTCQKLFERQG